MTREASISMNKARLSAQAFLAAVQGKTQDYELDGVGVVGIRSLTTPEAEQLTALQAEGTSAMLFKAIEVGLVEPTLSPDELAQLHTALPGPVMKLAAAIMQLSGMADKVGDLEGEAGGGS
jgi:hypothetical protein